MSYKHHDNGSFRVCSQANIVARFSDFQVSYKTERYGFILDILCGEKAIVFTTTCFFWLI